MIRNFYDRFLDIIYPPKCGFCGEITSTSSFVCDKCKNNHSLDYSKRCRFCGKETILKDSCFECKQKRIYYDKLIFYSEYTEEIRDKIHLYKFYNKKFYYNFFEELIYDRLIGVEADIIIPVPISKERLMERGYNQSSIIAKKLSKALKIGYNGDVIKKIVNSEKQSMQKFRERQKSVKNIFEIADNNIVRGKRVLLIDDVFATGATVNECSRILINAGAKSVIVGVISISHILK